MKVLLVNGSPHSKGCTFTALEQVAGQLGKAGIDTETMHIGNKAIRGCIDCRKCAQTGYCIFTDDPVNEAIDKLKAADGLVVGSPVYYAGPNATVCAFMDRVFFLKSAPYAFKPACAIASARRAGTVATWDRLNKYFGIARMPIVSSQYWNGIHGNKAEEAREDLEGMQTMRTLGDNMAWLLKCIEAGRNAGINPPQCEPAIYTNFIR
ncbi:MAG: flavodoxin family protein [Desulfovibrio sp.]|nr:flavodoxin family protein [Desulfovibrio sp.]